MLDAFLTRFTTLVDTLIANPRVRVTHVWRGAPATEAQLNDLSQAWGQPVPAALGTLYRQAAALGRRRRRALRFGAR